MLDEGKINGYIKDAQNAMESAHEYRSKAIERDIIEASQYETTIAIYHMTKALFYQNWVMTQQNFEIIKLLEKIGSNKG